MAYSRHQSREYALQALYQIEIHQTKSLESIQALFDEIGHSEDAKTFATQLVLETLDKQKEIDAMLKENLEKWRLDRLSIIVRNLLRLAVFEMCFFDTPYQVVIDEAVTMAKEFVDDTARSFVNSVLQKIHDRYLKSKNPVPSEL